MTIWSFEKMLKLKKRYSVKFFPQIGSYKSIQQFYRRQFEEKFWRNTFFFFWSRHFFQTSNCRSKKSLPLKMGLTVETTLQPETPYPGVL